MKQKRGFTLVELMATIVVLAIIIAIAMPIYNKLSINIKERNYINKVKLIETAAAKYSEDTNYETMYVDDLIKDGYLDADDEEGNIYNDLTNERINCYVVKSKEEAGIYYAELLDESYQLEDNTCIANMPNTMNDKLKIIMRLEDGNEFKYDKISKWWTKENIILEAQVIGEIKEIEWYQGFSQSPLDTNSKYFTDIQNNKDKRKIKVSTDSVLQQSYTVKVTLSDGKILNSTVRVYIDKIKPNFYDGNEINNTKWVLEYPYIIKAYDNESGLYGYEIVEQNQSCPTDIIKYAKNAKITFQSNGSKTLCIIDKVGNTNQKKIEITTIDKTAPSCYFNIKTPDGNDGWYKTSADLYLNSSAVGVGGVSLNITDSASPSYGSVFSQTTSISKLLNENMKNQKYYGYVKTGAGNTCACNISISMETSIKAPKFSKDDTRYNNIAIKYDFVAPTSGEEKRWCLFTHDGKVDKINPIGDVCWLGVYSTSTVKVQACIKSKAGNEKCSNATEVNLSISSSKDKKVYLIEHDIYYSDANTNVDPNIPSNILYDQCYNATYGAYCRDYTGTDSHGLSYRIAEYCQYPDKKGVDGGCLNDFIDANDSDWSYYQGKTFCTVNGFLKVTGASPVEAVSPLYNSNLSPEHQSKIIRSDKLTKPHLWTIVNPSDRYGDYRYHDSACNRTVPYYRFCDEGCGNGHVKNFWLYRTYCNASNQVEENGKYRLCENTDGHGAGYYGDYGAGGFIDGQWAGHVHDWSVSVAEGVAF